MEQVLFRASQLGKLMTDARTKTGLSETTKSALLEIYVANKYSRYKEMSNKFIEKGLAVENDAIDMWRRHRGEIVFKNEQMFANDFIKGTPDLLIKDDETDLVVNVPDIKSSWDIHTFFDAMTSDISKDYYWQGQAHTWCTTCHLLVRHQRLESIGKQYRLLLVGLQRLHQHPKQLRLQLLLCPMMGHHWLLCMHEIHFRTLLVLLIEFVLAF